MAASPFDSSDQRIAVLCRSCGKPWPASYAACPDDGTPLAARPRPADVHVAETMLLPGRREDWTEPDTAPHDRDGETRVDPIAIRRALSSAHVAVNEVRVVEPAAFTDSDAGEPTHARAPDSRPSPAPLPPPGSSDPPGASDPPTSFARRPGSHIDLPAGSVVNNEYEIDSRLGAGAMGEVYAARHLKLGKRVALKVIGPRLSDDPAAIERFEQEARTLAQMHHPGIVDVLGFGELADGRAYFVMEYLAGESLEERIDRGRVPFDEALDILDQMARALEAAHAHQVIHRDLKPANTYLVRIANEPRAIVKLLDFGLAKLAADVDRRAERTQSGVVIGTALYLSPEQARGPDVDHRTDVYALGCTAYELLLGQPPFNEAKTLATLIAAHLHQAPPMPRTLWPEIPAQLDLALFAMLAKDPAYRPTLAQLRHVIASVRAPAPTADRPQARSVVESGDYVVPAAPRWSRTATIGLAAAALFGGVLIGALALGSHTSNDKQHATVVPVPVPTASVDAGAAVVEPPAGAIEAGIVIAGSASPLDAAIATAGSASPLDAAVAAHVIPQSNPDASLAAVATPTPTPDAAMPPEIEPATVGSTPSVSDVPTRRPTPLPTKPPAIDRNQTVNPFAKKVNAQDQHDPRK